MFNDKKGDNTVKFRIKGQGVTEEPLGLFSIDENNGTVYVHGAIDRELNRMFHVRYHLWQSQDFKAGFEMTLC